MCSSDLPGAFSIDLKDVAGDWQAINKKVEEKVVAAGGKDRMGTWAYSLGYSEVLGAVDLVKDVLDGKKELTKIEDVQSAIAKYTEGANWMGSYYVDRASGEKKENHILVAQDDYIYGKGYLGMDKVEVPEKYLTMNIDLKKIQSEK